MTMGLCVTPVFNVEPTELNVPYYRSILYKLSDIDILLALGRPLIITLNNQCAEVRNDWTGWDITVYKLMEHLKAKNALNKLLLLCAGNEFDLYWHSDRSVPPEFGADLAIRTSRIAKNYGVKVTATSLAGPQWPAYLESLARLCRNDVDFFDIHPYGQRPNGWRDGQVWMHGDLQNVIQTVKDIGQKPVIMTEYGVKIVDAGGESNVANFLVAAHNTANQLDIKYTCWFAYSDAVGAPTEQGAQAFGLVSSTGFKRPAYYAYQTINKGQPQPQPPSLDEWKLKVGKGILDMMKADNTVPAMVSEWRPFDRPSGTPATIEQCIGLNGTTYIWHLPTNRSWRYKPS